MVEGARRKKSNHKGKGMFAEKKTGIRSSNHAADRKAERTVKMN